MNVTISEGDVTFDVRSYRKSPLQIPKEQLRNMSPEQMYKIPTYVLATFDVISPQKVSVLNRFKQFVLGHQFSSDFWKAAVQIEAIRGHYLAQLRANQRPTAHQLQDWEKLIPQLHEKEHLPCLHECEINRSRFAKFGKSYKLLRIWEKSLHYAKATVSEIEWEFPRILYGLSFYHDEQSKNSPNDQVSELRKKFDYQFQLLNYFMQHNRHLEKLNTAPIVVTFAKEVARESQIPADQELVGDLCDRVGTLFEENNLKRAANLLFEASLYYSKALSDKKNPRIVEISDKGFDVSEKAIIAIKRYKPKRWQELLSFAYHDKAEFALKIGKQTQDLDWTEEALTAYQKALEEAENYNIQLPPNKAEIIQKQINFLSSFLQRRRVLH